MLGDAWNAEDQKESGRSPPTQSARQNQTTFADPIKEHPDEARRSSQRQYNPNKPRDDVSVRFEEDSLHTDKDLSFEQNHPFRPARTDVHRPGGLLTSPKSLQRQDSLRTDPGYGDDFQRSSAVPPLRQADPFRSDAHPLGSNFPSAHAHPSGRIGESLAPDLSTVQQPSTRSHAAESNPLAPPPGISNVHAFAPS